MYVEDSREKSVGKTIGFSSTGLSENLTAMSPSKNYLTLLLLLLMMVMVINEKSSDICRQNSLACVRYGVFSEETRLYEPHWYHNNQRGY